MLSSPGCVTQMYLKTDISFSASLFHSEVICNLAVTYFLTVIILYFLFLTLKIYELLFSSNKTSIHQEPKETSFFRHNKYVQKAVTMEKICIVGGKILMLFNFFFSTKSKGSASSTVESD